MSKELFEDQKVWEQSNIDNPIDNAVNIIQLLANAVTDGTKDAIVALRSLSNIEKACKDAKEIVSELAMEESEKYPLKTFEHKGVKIERRSGRAMYNYKGIQEWSDLTAKVKNKESLYKSAFESWQKGARLFDEETGEEVPMPVVTHTKDVLIIKG